MFNFIYTHRSPLLCTAYGFVSSALIVRHAIAPVSVGTLAASTIGGIPAALTVLTCMGCTKAKEKWPGQARELTKIVSIALAIITFVVLTALGITTITGALLLASAPMAVEKVMSIGFYEYFWLGKE